VEFQFVITPEDFIQLQIFHNEHSVMGKRMRRLVGAAGLVFLLLITALMCRGFYAIPVFAAAFYILWYALFSKKQFRKGLRRRFEKEIRAGKYQEYLGMKTFSLEENRLRGVSAYSTEEMSYDSIAHVEKDDARFYIYTGTTESIVILVPFTAFADEAEKLAFLRLLEEKTTRRKQG